MHSACALLFGANELSEWCTETDKWPILSVCDMNKRVCVLDVLSFLKVSSFENGPDIVSSVYSIAGVLLQCIWQWDTLVKQSCRLYIQWYPCWWSSLSFPSASTMHLCLLLTLQLVSLTLATSSQNATDNLTTSSRMSEVLHLPNTYPAARVHQFKPLTMSEPMQMGAQMMGSWPQRSHNIHPQYHHHFPTHVPGSPIVPLAVSFSVGYLLFRLLALGAIFLEKGYI